MVCIFISVVSLDWDATTALFRRKRREGSVWHPNSISSRVLRSLRINQLSLIPTNLPTPKGVAGSPSGRSSPCMHLALNWSNPTVSRWICSQKCPASLMRSASRGFLSTRCCGTGSSESPQKHGVRFSADAPRNAPATPPSIRLALTAISPSVTTPTDQLLRSNVESHRPRGCRNAVHHGHPLDNLEERQCEDWATGRPAQRRRPAQPRG